jgi:hypothetical protein
MSAKSTYVDRYEQLPRSTRWIVLATAFLLVYLLWSQVLQPTAASWSSKADTIETHLAVLKGNAGVPTDVRHATVGFGNLELPNSKKVGSSELVRKVQSILEAHGIKNDKFTMGRSTPIQTARSIGLTAGNLKLERIKGEVDFETTPKIAIKIISAMEAEPAIEAISSLKLDRTQDEKVKIRMTIEAWVRAGRSRSGR